MSQKHTILEVSLPGFFWSIFLFTQSFKKLKQKRQIEDLATSLLSSASQGLVELEGFAWPINNPYFSKDQEPLVYYRISIEERVRRNKSSSWEERETIEWKDPFYFCDKSGAAIINLNEIPMSVKRITTSLSNEELKNETFTFFQKSKPNFNWRPNLFSGSLRMVEEKIYAGAPLFFCGSLSASQNLHPPIQDIKLFTYRNKFNKIHSKIDAYRFLFDKNNDDSIDENEARMGYHLAFKNTHEDKRIPPNSINTPFFGELKKHEHLQSILADCHQNHYLKRLGSLNSLKMIFSILLMGFFIFLTYQELQKHFS